MENRKHIMTIRYDHYNKNWNPMKYHFIILISILLGYLPEGKSQIKFQPLKEFNYDTMAYMEKNYNAGSLYVYKTIGNVLEEAEIPFRSYILGESPEELIGIVWLFTQSAEEVKALYRAGKPVYGVFCDLEESYYASKPGNVYKTLTGLGTNQINKLKKSSVKALKDLKINWAWFYDQRDWFPTYKVEE